MVLWNDENVAHFLSRAGFGAKPSDIKLYRMLGQAKAVDKLVAVPPSRAKGPGKSDDNSDIRELLKQWWARRMVKATSRRLHEKLALFWHDHFASSWSVVQNNLWMAAQNRTFRYHGLGPMRTLIFEITRDPAMLEFLDNRRNTKTKPNENYARELMELFTLGVTDLNGVDNYTQTDVGQLARCLTGWIIQDDAGLFVPSRYDNGSKTLFAGKSYQASGNIGVVDSGGVLLPPAQNLIDVLFTHRDSDGALTMPRFIARKLWEYLAYPAPSKALLDELTAPFIAGGFVVADLVRSMLLHDEFYSVAAKTQGVKNPCEYAFHAVRALNGGTNAKTLPDLLEDMGMTLFDPPTVNGWNTGLAWLSTGQFLARMRFAQALAAGTDGTLKITPSKLYDQAATTPGPVIDGLLSQLGIASHVPPAVRQELITYFGTDFSNPLVVEAKVRGVVALILALPEFNIH
jgi:uncharacterized protein (DUF1800 family)